jgi:transposase
MTSMTRTTVGVTGGVDTHRQSHHAAVIDHLGRQLGDCEFPASPVGYGVLVEWLQGHGVVDRVGVEGTGTYGAGLARHLRGEGMVIVEVHRPDRGARRAHGKSDPLDAYSAVGLRCLVLPRSCRSYATAGSRRFGRFVWHDPVPSKPEVRPRIKSNP